jgi:hypothetical protein
MLVELSTEVMEVESRDRSQRRRVTLSLLIVAMLLGLASVLEPQVELVQVQGLLEVMEVVLLVSVPLLMQEHLWLKLAAAAAAEASGKHLSS